jgi:hypothetical protein
VSPDEAFLGVALKAERGKGERAMIYVFSRAERVEGCSPPAGLETHESTRGYAAARTLDLRLTDACDLAWGPSGHLLACTRTRGVFVLDPANGRETRRVCLGLPRPLRSLVVCSRAAAAEHASAVEFRFAWAVARALARRGRGGGGDDDDASDGSGESADSAVALLTGDRFPSGAFRRVVRLASPGIAPVLALLDGHGELHFFR